MTGLFSGWSEIQLLLSSFYVSFIPLGCVYFLLFIFVFLFGTSLNTEGTERKWAMEEVQKSSCGVWWLESLLWQQTYCPFWDLKISCLSQLLIQKAENKLGS